MTSATHDPGGRVALALGVDIDGSAEFSPCGRYRSTLRRWRKTGLFDQTQPAYALWIGLNPSVAGADLDDPTVHREWRYTERQLGLTHYVKVNVFDYRATKPERLLALAPEDRQSATNADLVVALAIHADVAIAAWGALHKQLRPDAQRLRERLNAAGVALKCVGLTAEGFPRHPLYTRSDAKLIALSTS